VSENWPSDSKDGCKLPSNLLKLIQIVLSFEKELEDLKVHLNEMK
jgi:hypothetical protein